MSTFGRDQTSTHEAVRQAESRAGGLEVLFTRYKIINNSLELAEASPTITRAFENIRRAKAAAERLEYEKDTNRIIQAAEIETAKILAAETGQSNITDEQEELIPVLSAEEDEATRQAKMVARARADTENIHARAVTNSQDARAQG